MNDDVSSSNQCQKRKMSKAIYFQSHSAQNPLKYTNPRVL